MVAAADAIIGTLTVRVSSVEQMMSLEGDDNSDLPGEGGETNKRSERKRQREKQRRTDLTNAFDELASFIFQIEPEAGDPDVDAKKKRKKSGAGPARNEHGEESSGITRLDLIGRALRIMKRLHRENEERKRMIEHMRERRSGHQGNDNVLVMVPTLSPADEPPAVARASYPPYYHQGAPMSHMTQPPPDYMIPIQGRHPSAGYPPHIAQGAAHWGNYGRVSHPQGGQHRGQHGSYPPSARSPVALPKAPPASPDGKDLR